jgi:hypothetical protein
LFTWYTRIYQGIPHKKMVQKNNSSFIKNSFIILI